MLLLRKFGLSSAKCRQISQEFSTKEIENNPYSLVALRGISFKYVDERIALPMGIASDSPLRLEAFIMDVLRNTVLNGDTASLQRYKIFSELRMYGFSNRITVEAKLSEMVEEELLIQVEFNNNIYLQLPEHASNESDIALRLKSIENTKSSSIPRTALKFTSHQGDRRAISLSFRLNKKMQSNNALSSKVSIITGGPGNREGHQ